MSYTISDFAVGETVYFKHPSINNYDLYWQIISINFQTKRLELQVNENGESGHEWIDVKYIYRKEF